jgi:hypothetical protein
MMIFMMGGMHGGHGGSDQNTGHSQEQDRDHRPTSGQR